MKSIKLIGLSLLAVFALGAFAAVSASAEEGFLPTPKGTILVLGGKSILEGANTENIKCEKLDDSTITFTNDKTASGKFHWLECTAAFGFQANSLGDAAGVILAEVKLLVCLDPKDVNGKLLEAFGVAGEVSKLHLEVPTVGVLKEVNGIALGLVLTAGPAKLWSVEFLGSKGAQTARSCLQGANTINHTLNVKTDTGAAESASENVEAGLVQFPEEVKLEDS